jgi:hypothetical protein
VEVVREVEESPRRRRCQTRHHCRRRRMRWSQAGKA